MSGGGNAEAYRRARNHALGQVFAARDFFLRQADKGKAVIAPCRLEEEKFKDENGRTQIRYFLKKPEGETDG